MKTLFNLTTDAHDLCRYKNSEDLSADLAGFDGLELMCYETDERGIVLPGQVVGVHMSFFACWLDFWLGDEQALIKEFDTLKNAELHYGGLHRSALLNRFRADLDSARRYGAEYVVFHVSDCTTQEVYTRRFKHTSAQVVDAACQLLNQLFKDVKDGPALLLENLWYPGLDFTDPELTRRLLEGIDYKNKGIMLDTGHLLHTNPAIRTQEQGLAYIQKQLDAHGDLVGVIRGIHLNQSLTGEYQQRVAGSPPVLESSFLKRQWQLLEHVLQVDLHRPFTCGGIGDFIRRTDPQYLVYEFITRSRDQHRQYLKEQRDALNR
jgi:sugar phosphate isomerase/epimerase